MWNPRNLKECYSIDDLRMLARRRLPGPVFHMLDGGAETEFTARRNIGAFDEYSLVPRSLIDVGEVRTATRVLGQDLKWPLICGPTGLSRLFDPLGERLVAEAAAQAGIPYCLSTVATCSLEGLAAASNGPKVFQLYIFKDRAVTWDLIERAKRAGYAALCLTVDVPVNGKRERDLQTGFGYPIRPTLRSVIDFACHAPWLIRQMSHGRLSMPIVAAQCGSSSLMEQSRFITRQLDPSMTWKDAAEMIGQWRGPFAIKGIMSADDARRAADVGATAIVVSNHGARQLDGAASTIEVLPEIVAAVGDKLDVIVDGGIRRGSHILKALALGAKACAVGRPYLYGLAAGGGPGVAKALEILRSEFVRAMQLSGVTDAAVVDPALVRHRRAP